MRRRRGRRGSTKETPRRSRGVSSVLLVVSTAIVLFSLGCLMAYMSSSGAANEMRLENTVRARYMAEAGLAIAYNELRGGKTSVSINRKLFKGKVRVASYPGRNPVSGKPRLDLLSQGVAGREGVILFSRIQIDPPQFRGPKPPPKNQKKPKRTGAVPVLIEFQLAVPKGAVAPVSPSKVQVTSAAVHNRIESWFGKHREEGRKRYTEEYAPLGRQELVKRCWAAVATLVGQEAITPRDDAPGDEVDADNGESSP